MKIILFSRVPRWYSFKNERLVSRLTSDGHEIAGVIVERTATLASLLEWKNKLGYDVFFSKIKNKALGGQKQIGRMESAAVISPKVSFVDSHNSPGCVKIVRSLEPDLIILRGCGILKKQILEIPRIGVINPHYASLPDFRGMDVTEWSVLCGCEVAVSIHTVDEGVDTGVVLVSKIIEPTAGDTVGSLRDKSAALAVDLIATAVSELANGKPFPRSSIKEVGGKQYFQMHSRLKRLANMRLRQFAVK